ncbi:MAG: murein biosynthesis integral membrane protein MurJ [Candidatus Omnitrophica bacterium]|nr:murein biosynthesis integral membrane protein MurJ [Candidatus Omnitrophota bacterium]
MSNNNSGSQNSHKSIMRSTSIISLGTLSSRVLGFVRDVILAKLFGTGFQADAFFVALKIPNLFRDMVGEGATNSAIVPVFSEYLVKKERAEFWRFVSIILTWALIVLSAITVLGVLLAPIIVRAIAPGFMADPGKLELTIRLTRILFPYLILIGLTANSIAVLYTFRAFTIPAFSPCLLNVAIIISALIAPRCMAEPVYGLAFGVLAGGVLQLIVQLGPLKKAGLRLKRPKTLNHPGVSHVGKLLVPRLFGAGVYQLSVFIDTFCASLAFIVGAGGISAIYYANRIIQFPMGVFSFAIASAALPAFSDLATRKDIEQLKKTVMFSLENVFFVMFPTSVIIMLLATPMIRVLFERGEFGTYSTMITSVALFFYAIGLFSFGGIKILVAAFHALQDTKTPVKVAAGCLLINATLNFLLMITPLKVGGIALASAIAATVDFLWLFALLKKRLGVENAGFGKFVERIFWATLVTAVGVYLAWEYVVMPYEFLKIAVVGLGGLIVYEIVCCFLKVPQAEKIWQAIRSRF